jgi:hypothetical protein
MDDPATAIAITAVMSIKMLTPNRTTAGRGRLFIAYFLEGFLF